MRISSTLLLISAALFSVDESNAGESNPPVTNAPARLQLRDQFDAPQKLSFPATHLTLLTIADKKGSAQIAGWVAPVMQRFATRIEVCGIADVSSVPAPLRGLVRKRFQKDQPRPVLMDWSGDTVRRFGYVPGKADILVLDRNGQILRRHSGEAGEGVVQEFLGVIERALAAEIETVNQPALESRPLP